MAARGKWNSQIAIERDNLPAETGKSKGNVTLTLFSNKDIAGGISSYEVVNQIVHKPTRSFFVGKKRLKYGTAHKMIK